MNAAGRLVLTNPAVRQMLRLPATRPRAALPRGRPAAGHRDAARRGAGRRTAGPVEVQLESGYRAGRSIATSCRWRASAAAARCSCCTTSPISGAPTRSAATSSPTSRTSCARRSRRFAATSRRCSTTRRPERSRPLSRHHRAPHAAHGTARARSAAARAARCRTGNARARRLLGRGDRLGRGARPAGPARDATPDSWRWPIDADAVHGAWRCRKAARRAPQSAREREQLQPGRRHDRRDLAPASAIRSTSRSPIAGPGSRRPICRASSSASIASTDRARAIPAARDSACRSSVTSSSCTAGRSRPRIATAAAPVHRHAARARMNGQFAAYVSATFLLVVTPGATTAVVVTQRARRGTTSGLCRRGRRRAREHDARDRGRGRRRDSADTVGRAS